MDQDAVNSRKLVNSASSKGSDITHCNISASREIRGQKRITGPRAHWEDADQGAPPRALLRQAVAKESDIPLLAAYNGAPVLDEESFRQKLQETEGSLFPEPLFQQGPAVRSEFRDSTGLSEIIDDDSLNANQCPEALVLKIMDNFVNPLENWVCTKGFGARSKKGFHNGIDLASKSNVPVYAIGDGKVVFAGALPRFHAYGKVVVIDHGCGVFSLYGHVSPLKRLEKRKRRTKDAWRFMPVFVDAGFKIATLTAYKRRGESTSGPHLHLEILVANKKDGKTRFTFHNPAHCLPLRKKRWFRPLLPEVYASRTLECKAISRGRDTIRAPKLRGLRAVLESLNYPLALKRDDYPGLAGLVNNPDLKAINRTCSLTQGLHTFRCMIEALECEKRERVASLLGGTGDKRTEENNDSYQYMDKPVTIRADHQVSSYMRLEESLSNSIELRIGVSSAQEVYDN